MKTDRRTLFKFLAGAAAGVAVGGGKAEAKGTFLDLDDTPKSYALEVGTDVLFTDKDIPGLLKGDGFTVSLPPPIEGRTVIIKNNLSYESITVVSDGENWHLT